jgi:ATP-binding cassette subfamily F protein uup
MKGFSKSYTDKILFDKADFSVNSGDKIGVIGINGTGKSSLLKMIAGLDTCDEGSFSKGSNVVVRYLPQSPDFTEPTSIYDYVVTTGASPVNQWTIEGDAKSLLNRLGFSDISLLTNTLSGGQKKKVALAAALLSSCDILVLDEPTNHLDNDMTEYLEEYLKNYKGALVMVTHDRYFLDAVCNRIVEIDKGKTYSYDAGYEGYLMLKAQRENIALATQAKHQNILRKEIAWMQRGARARSTKQKAHIARYEKLASEELIKESQNVVVSSSASRLGNKTVEIYNISKSWPNKSCPVIDNFSYNFLRTDRIGIVGVNGCGKTTLVKLITGIIKPDSGHIEIGETVKIGYFSQENEYLNPSMKVLDYVKETAEFISTPEGLVSASTMCERFLFDGTLQHQKIEKLSGGEKRRLYLLKVLTSSPNVLILDEPTNDLDIQTLQILEDYLDNFQGILIVVSHDRYFLDRVVRKLLVFDNCGHINQFEGGYTDYYVTHGSFAGSGGGINSYGSSGTGNANSASDIKRRGTDLNGGAYGNNSRNFGVDTDNSSDGHERGKSKAPAPAKKKFTFNEQREYDSIEDNIEKAEAKLAQIDKDIESSVSDFVKLNELTAQREEASKELDYLLERYVYLTDLAEQFKG